MIVAGRSDGNWSGRVTISINKTHQGYVAIHLKLAGYYGDALASNAGSCNFSAGRNPQPQEGKRPSANKAPVLDAKTIVLRGKEAVSLRAAALFA